MNTLKRTMKGRYEIYKIRDLTIFHMPQFSQVQNENTVLLEHVTEFLHSH